MDHLPKPSDDNALRPRLEFSLRCDPNGYDGGPLESYPERKGFRLNYWHELKYANVLSLPDGSRPNVEQSEKLLQVWLFFGFLSVTHSIYGTSFNGNDYVKTKGGNGFLTLEKFMQHSEIWYKLEDRLTKTERRQHFRACVDHQMRALRFLTNNFTKENHGSIGMNGLLDNVVSEESRITVESSLDVLLLALQEAMDFVTRTIYFRERRSWHGLDSENVSFSMQKLIQSLPWCPSDLNITSLTFDNSSLYFASRLHRNSAGISHSNCTSSKCHAFDMEISD